MSQSQLNAIIIAVVLIIVLAIFWSIPATRIVPVVIWSIFVMLVLLIWGLLVVAAIFIVPYLALYLVRQFVDFLDASVDQYNDINNAVHVVICILLSVVVSALWMIYGVRFVVGLPSWVNELYHYFGLYDGLFESLPWGWGVVSLISSIAGYISGSSDS